MHADLIVNADATKANLVHVKKNSNKLQNVLVIRKNLIASATADALKVKLVIAINANAVVNVLKANLAHVKKILLVLATKKIAIVNAKRKSWAYLNANVNANAVANLKKASKV